jgi:hypothetical protein
LKVRESGLWSLSQRNPSDQTTTKLQIVFVSSTLPYASLQTYSDTMYALTIGGPLDGNHDQAHNRTPSPSTTVPHHQLHHFEPLVLHLDKAAQTTLTHEHLENAFTDHRKNADLPHSPHEQPSAAASPAAEPGSSAQGATNVSANPAERARTPVDSDELAQLVDSAHELSADDENDDAAPPAEPPERVPYHFYSGHPTAELCGGSLAFFRYAQPAGALGLRPPRVRSNLIAVINVPASMASPDLLRFLGAYRHLVRFMRMVRDASRPHVHCLLLQFRSPAHAERFRRDFHGRRYNSLEPEVVVAVHVAQVTFGSPQPPPPPPEVRVQLRLHVTTLQRDARGVLSPAAGRHRAAVADVVGADVVGGGAASTSGATAVVGSSAESPDSPARARAPAPWRVATSLQLRPVAQGALSGVPSPPPLPELPATLAEAVHAGTRCVADPGELHELLGPAVELPSCAVCLERLDPVVSGVFTVLCNHTFHVGCLSRWQDSSCPVCRYAAEDAADATQCELCGATENLWICLVCGRVGCGRYGCGAGVLHNERTGHNFAMELSSQRVWDYAGDNYVHRLIQNRVDGKLVELPHPGGSNTGDGADEAGMCGGGGGGGARPSSVMDTTAIEMKQRNLEEQHEAVVHEYSLLLTGQLEVQRQHFEGQLGELTREHSRLLSEREEAIELERTELAARRIEIERDAKASAKRAGALQATAKEALSDAKLHRELNEQLVQNQDALNELLAKARSAEAAAKQQVGELEEQLRDLSFHLEAQLKIMDDGVGGGSELSGGNVQALPAATRGTQGRRRDSKASASKGARR